MTIRSNLPKVCLVCKRDRFSGDATAIARGLFGDRLDLYAGSVGDPLPEPLRRPEGAIIISFLSPWIIPQETIDAAQMAINFHPASRDYPGIGCYNFALYDNATEFGSVCHFMKAKVDTGALIDEQRFPVFPEDTVEQLKLRTMATMLAQFTNIASKIRAGAPLQANGLEWSRKPFTRKQLNQLTIITADMDATEVRRRVRATTYPGYPGPAIEIDGVRFEAEVPDGPAIA